MPWPSSADDPALKLIRDEEIRQNSTIQLIASENFASPATMAANKIAGIRAATVHDVTSARLTKQHNDANVICIGERLTGPEVAKDCVDAYLAAEFEGGRHEGRVAKLDSLGGESA